MPEFLTVIITISSIISIIYMIFYAIHMSSGSSLQKKFIRLGDMTGKTRKEIISSVGPPSAISAMPNGGQLLQWQATGYHIAILFSENGMFKGIQHEFSV